MSTRSHIGIWKEDGSLDVIYCHWDGYSSYNGALLLHHYQEPEKIRELIDLGDISSSAKLRTETLVASGIGASTSLKLPHTTNNTRT